MVCCELKRFRVVAAQARVASDRMRAKTVRARRGRWRRDFDEEAEERNILSD